MKKSELASTRRQVGIAWILLLLLAAAVRILPAARVFPAQGDAAHMVQSGITIRHQGLDKIDVYFSIAPQLIVALADRFNLPAPRCLQTTTIFWGVALAAGIIFLGRTLTQQWVPGLIAGALVSSNPILVDSATSGLSETPHMALAIWGFALCHHGLEKEKWRWLALGAFCWALDLYYRPYDLALLMGVFVLFVAYRFRHALRKSASKGIVTACAVLVFFGFPVIALTISKQKDMISSSKLCNLALADYGLDAKAMWEEKGINGANTPLRQEIILLQNSGTVRYLWARRTRILQRFVPNLLRAGRIINDFAFTGSFRAGFSWFVLASLAMVYGACRGGMTIPAAYSAMSIAIVPLSLAVSYIHPRWMMQCLPFYFLMIGMALFHGLRNLHSQRWLGVAAVLMLVFVLMNSSLAVRRLEARWQDRNIAEVGQRLRAYAGDADKLMCFGPELPICFFQTNMWNYVEIPYGPVNQIAAWADLQQVDLIVLCSSQFSHFPIHALATNPDLVPQNWAEIDRMIFKHQTRAGPAQESWVVYRRTAQD